MRWESMRHTLGIGIVVVMSVLLGAVLLLSLLGLLLGLATGGLMLVNDLRNVATWRDKTTPLDTATTQQLCLAFNIPSTDSRCQAGAATYGPEFFKTIQRTFPVDGPNQATFDQVQAKLGKNEFKREPLVKVSDGTEYFVVRYDLRGDRVYPIVMFFYADGRLFRLIADIGD